MKPTLPYTDKELARVEIMVDENMADPIYPISRELSYEIAFFRLACESCQEFMVNGLKWLEKQGNSK